MSTIEKAGFFILMIGSLIFVHELGHFLVAKLFKVKVLQFSFGFGPRLAWFKGGETEYQIAALPLGGYVKLAGADPTEPLPPEDKGRGLFDQAPWKRTAIFFAGPAMSLLFPVLVYFIAFSLQTEALSTTLGLVTPDQPAWAAGLRPGDRIVDVDGVPAREFGDLRELISPKYDRQVTIHFERAGKLQTTTLVPERIEEPGVLGSEPRGLIGVSPFPAKPYIGISDPGSPAARAGLAPFDLIVQVGDKKVATYLELEATLAAQTGPVELLVVREKPEGGAAGALTSYDTLKVTVASEERAGRPYFGIEPTDLYVFSVAKDTPAWNAGIRRGDRLVEANGSVLGGWASLERIRLAVPEKPLRIVFLHEGTRVEREVQQDRLSKKDEFGTERKSVVFGAFPDGRESSVAEAPRVPIRRTLGEAFSKALKVVPAEIHQTAVVLARLFTFRLSPDALGGPLMIWQLATKSAELGWEPYLRVMGAISINLGLVNLVPIPILDGFHILSAGVEAIRRRPLSMRARMVANYIGLAMLISLMLLAFKNDIVRMFLQ